MDDNFNKPTAPSQPRYPMPARADQQVCAGCEELSCERCDVHERPRCNLQCYNWLDDVPGGQNDFDIIEVHFKNTRRGFYRNPTHIPLKQGDWVAVEASPGHDIGQVAMTGLLVKKQMKRANLKPNVEILRVFRKARENDMQRYREAKSREVDTMIRSRKIAVDLGLKMKIGDVEYQGDGNKAIFYYIADERVDFRQLIKVLAETFKIRVEMKQIGARQEAGRIGGIGPCGRPLCCATWMTNFVSVATSAARYQDISLNPQKLAGQCAKLKCCINFEVNSYVEASKEMPPRDVRLETTSETYYHFKADMLKREITYSTQKNMAMNTVTIPVERAFEVIELNRQGIKPEHLDADDVVAMRQQKAFGDILGQDSINRFDKKKKKKKKKGKNDAPAADNAATKPAAQPQQPAKQNGDGNSNNNGNKDRRDKRPKQGKQPQQGQGGGKQQQPNPKQPQQQQPKPKQQQPQQQQPQQPAPAPAPDLNRPVTKAAVRADIDRQRQNRNRNK